MSMTLHGAAWSVHTQRVLFAMYEKQLDDVITFNPCSWGDRLEVSYTALQPFQKFPVLVDGAHPRGGQPFVLFESIAIARYLDDLYPTRGTALQVPTTPTDAATRAVQNQWMSVEASTLYPPFVELLTELKWGPALFGKTADKAKAQAIVESLKPVLKVINDALKSDGRQYLAGAFGIVDVTIAPFLNRISSLSECAELLRGVPEVIAWWKRIEARPAWQQVCKLDKA
jgi:glutathione S-transferase